MHVAIVEPHYDDAWLSLGGTILSHPHVRFTIVSVSHDDTINPVDRTILLASRLPNVATHALGLRDLGWQREVALARARAAGKEDLESLFLVENGLSSLAEVASSIDALVPDADRVALPFGIFHPMHEVVARLRPSAPAVRYLEYPYRFYPDERASLEARARDLFTWRCELGELARIKLRTFEEVYPAQGFVLELAPTRLADADEVLVAGEASLLPPW